MTIQTDSHAPRVPTITRALYGFGSVAYGVKDNGFSAFLMVFYNQVIGLPSTLVGLAIFIALLADAFIDPAIGHMSDNLKSRWGRRHPFIYGCIIPVSLFYLLLWFPPEGSDMVRFFYLLGTAFIVRVSISCFEITAAALLPELTRDYDERTAIMAWRYMFGWTGSLGILIFSYSFLLVSTPEYPVGQANRDGYEIYAYIAAAAMAISILVAGLATHHRIPDLIKATGPRQSLRESFTGIIEAYRNKAFGILMLAGVLGYTIQGVAFVLFPYLYAYYWGFSQSQIGLYFALLILVAIIAAILAPMLSKHLGKRKAMVIATLFWEIPQALPYILNEFGMMPERGTTALMVSVFAMAMPGVCMGIVSMIISASVMADIVEEHEENTGKRAEGIFFAGSFFMQKCTTGLGILIAGLILSAVAFPENANPATLGADVKSNLAWTYVTLILIMGSIAAWIFSTHPHDRASHTERLARLSAREKIAQKM